MTSTDTPTVPLGVGTLISETFGLTASQFMRLVPILFVPNFFVSLASVLLVGGNVLASTEPVPMQEPNVAGLVIVMLLQLVAGSLATAVVIMIIYDAKLGRRTDLGAAVRYALGYLVPIVVLSLAAGIASGLATLALVVPGLWVFAVFSMLVPCVLVEQAGFNGLSRSAQITKGYRWPVLGALVVVMIVVVVLSIVLQAVLAPIAMSLGVAVSVLVFSLIAAVTGIPYCVLITLIYARLREIKEGRGVEDLADIFS